MDVAILVALIAINALFAMAEVALLTAKRSKLQRMVDSGDRQAAAGMGRIEQGAGLINDRAHRSGRQVLDGLQSALAILNGAGGPAPARVRAALDGIGVFLNSGAMIGHDTVVGDFTSIMPMSAISGNVVIGECCMIGVQTAIRQGLAIGRNCTVGMGSIVLRDVPDDSTVLGNPAKKVS